MFKTITYDPKSEHIKQSSESFIKSLNHHYNLGRNEWQQDYSTTTKNFFQQKPVKNILFYFIFLFSFHLFNHHES